jgi:hypothetical protein
MESCACEFVEIAGSDHRATAEFGALECVGLNLTGRRLDAMKTDKQRRLALLQLAAGCLQEAVERLHKLCPRLHNGEHEAECTEIAHNITAQIAAMQRLFA